MTPAAQLRVVRNLLTPPGAWLPVSFQARAADGRAVPCRSPEAVAWGLLGALVAVTGPSDDRMPTLAALRSVTGAIHLCDWHGESGRTHDEVLGALDRALEEAEDPHGYGRAG